MIYIPQYLDKERYFTMVTQSRVFIISSLEISGRSYKRKVRSHSKPLLLSEMSEMSDQSDPHILFLGYDVKYHRC